MVNNYTPTQDSNPGSSVNAVMNTPLLMFPVLVPGPDSTGTALQGRSPTELPGRAGGNVNAVHCRINLYMGR